MLKIPVPMCVRNATILLVSLFLLIAIDLFAQAPSNLLPPPVNITYSVPGAAKAGDTIAITITIVPQSDMHLDINCLLPRGIEPVIDPGVSVIPYREKFTPNPERQKNYRMAVNLWVGPLKAQEVKTFTFHVTAAKSGSYKLICLADALKQWGQQEADYTINVN